MITITMPSLFDQVNINNRLQSQSFVQDFEGGEQDGSRMIVACISMHATREVWGYASPPSVEVQTHQ